MHQDLLAVGLQHMKLATMDDREIDEAELTSLIATTNRLITDMVDRKNDKNMLCATLNGYKIYKNRPSEYMSF